MRLRALATAAAIALTALPAYAHFGVLMPGSELVNRPKTPLELTLAFLPPGGTERHESREAGSV